MLFLVFLQVRTMGVRTLGADDVLFEGITPDRLLAIIDKAEPID